MNDNTNSYRDKGRAVFLAAIMVLSVVAVSVSFTGAAAAAITGTSTDGPAQAEAGDTIELAVTAEADGANISTLQVNPEEQADHVNQFAGASVLDAGAETQIEEPGFIVYSELQEEVTATYELEVPDDAEVGDEFTITGDALDGNNARTQFSYTVEIAENVNDGPAAAYAGPDFDDYEDGLAGQNLWQGQVFTLNNDSLTAGEDVSVYERIDADTTVLASEVSADKDSVSVDTENFEAGNYFVYAPDSEVGVDRETAKSNEDLTFGITEQSLTAAFGVDSVTNEGPNSDDTDFEFESNRASYPINVTTSSGDLDTETLEDIFVENSSFITRTSNVNEDDDTLVIGLPGTENEFITDNDEYVVDFAQADVDPGEYEFIFSGTDSTAEDTDTLEVTESNQDAQFADGIERQAAGDIAEFNLTLEDTGDAFVQIGGEESNFVEVLYIEEDEAGPMNVQINTRLLGTSADREAVYDTDNVATLYSANHANSDGENTLTQVLNDLNADEDLSGVGPNDLSLYEDDGQPFTNDFNQYVDNIGIADNAANQLSRPVQPTDYQVAVAGTNNVDNAVFDADPGGEANNQLGSMTLELTQPEINGVTTHTAPEEAADDEADVNELLDVVTAREEVAVEDRLVVQFEATGIFGALVANSSGLEDASDFDRLTDDGMSTQVVNNLDSEEGVTIEVVAEDDIGNQEPLELDLSASDSETYMVLDQANDQFFLIADTGSDDAFANGDAPSEATDFTATIEYDADDGGDRYEFDIPNEAGDRPADGHPDPFESSHTNFPYLQQGNVIDASADLTLAPRSIDFDNVNDEDQIEAPASEDSEISATTNVAPGSDAEIRVTSTDASSSFRQGNDVNITEDGSITTTFDLGSQETGDVFDTNYRVEGTAIDTVEGVVVESVDQDDGEETNETDDGMTDDGETNETDDGMTDDGETNETDDGSTDDGSTDDGTPGFGAVVALIALIGAALLAVRRQN